MNSGLEEGQQSYTPLHMGLPPIQTPSPLSHMHPCALFMPLFSVPGPIPIYHSSPPFTFSNTFQFFVLFTLKKKKKERRNYSCIGSTQCNKRNGTVEIQR